MIPGFFFNCLCLSMGKYWKHLLFFTILTIIISLVGVLLFYPAPSPPESTVRYAHMALISARKNNAHIYAENLFSEAQSYYDSAMNAWKRENLRFIYKRKYDSVLHYADLSMEKSYLAIQVSQTSISDLKVNLAQKLDILNTIVLEISQRFEDYPLNSEIREQISKGGFLLEEGEQAYQNEDYLRAESKILESEHLLVSSYKYAHAHLSDYFGQYPQWRRWIASTIALSDTTNDYSIIVDKYSRKLIVYHDGKKYAEYSAELGQNWVGDKKVRGDKATPEGKYRITRKLRNGNTQYYKALLLNYPDEEDIANFEDEKARGSIPQSAKIGGLIEIHGHGGKGMDWTDGCIALTNKDMDSLFKIAKVGTPVTIVGSRYDLKQILNN